jgi:hypothetical protein
MKSPRYIPYAEIAKNIENFKDHMRPNWILSSLFSLVSINYLNHGFYDNVINYLLKDKSVNII